MDAAQKNLIVGLGFVFGGLLVVGLLVALMGSKAGEVAAALGGVVGGAIGAGGAAASVLMMLAGQRADDLERVSAALMMEITEFCKFPVGQIGLCNMIQFGDVSPPISLLPQIMHTPEPVIYKALADQISRLSSATYIVSFFNRINEARGVIDMIVLASPDAQVFPSHPRLAEVDHIRGLADLLISQCQIAKLILESDDKDRFTENAIARERRLDMLKKIDQTLAASRIAFPNADAFSSEKVYGAA